MNQPKRLKAPQRRASIVAAARSLFAERGYHGVAVDEIARRLQVSPAVLYQHFASKEALYAAVVTELAVQRESYVEAALAGPDDFASVLRRLTRVFVQSVMQDPEPLRMELQSMLDNPDQARLFFESRWKGLTDYIEFGLRELAQYQRINKLEPRVAGLLYQGMLRETLLSKCLLQADRFKSYPVERLIDQLLVLFFSAIGYKETDHA